MRLTDARLQRAIGVVRAGGLGAENPDARPQRLRGNAGAGSQAAAADWRASPIRASDFSGLPPALVLTAELWVTPAGNASNATSSALRKQAATCPAAPTLSRAGCAWAHWSTAKRHAS